MNLLTSTFWIINVIWCTYIAVCSCISTITNTLTIVSTNSVIRTCIFWGTNFLKKLKILSFNKQYKYIHITKKSKILSFNKQYKYIYISQILIHLILFSLSHYIHTHAHILSHTTYINIVDSQNDLLHIVDNLVLHMLYHIHSLPKHYNFHDHYKLLLLNKLDTVSQQTTI